jgi:hypothetical protein
MKKKGIIAIFSLSIITASMLLLPIVNVTAGTYYDTYTADGVDKTQKQTIFWFNKLTLNLEFDIDVYYIGDQYYFDIYSISGGVSRGIDPDYEWTTNDIYWDFTYSGGYAIVARLYYDGRFEEDDSPSDYIDITVTLSITIVGQESISSTWDEHMSSGNWREVKSA